MTKYQVLKRQKPWRDAYYYQKSETLYQMTYVFCQRFLPAHGDRTVDQMVQAARSGKQNIVEGTEDGQTSTEMHIKLLNVARASIQELREDYRDYLLSRHLPLWDASHGRYSQMHDFCKQHNRLEEYQPYLSRWTDEEMANIALTLCYMTDSMLNHCLIKLEREFVEQGGIKERMHAARTGYRKEQDEELASLRRQVPLLQAEIQRLKNIIASHGIEL
ncbi:MAG: four helix bundle suffix domain-containing protein [Prevotella sp.]|nr:four helix bundle suffix domain-containing protein [Prevotella sp.]MBQ7452063.1 four helix bundle suffix domain-containing protein [Prevotella sp.]MBQ8060061.1 four helix bundle suffix domain-containing protein [Prevotella sp.]MBQ8115023.1 four helix bundle suffix domain-containing protein [Prevotella sp.]